jgi:hypothetical protein
MRNFQEFFRCILDTSHTFNHAHLVKSHHLLIIGAGLLTAGCTTSPTASSRLHPPAAVKTTPAADLLIISATYGSGTNYADVTYRVNDLLRQPDVEFFARPEWLAVDPTPGWNKALVIVYEFKRCRHTFTIGEGGRVSASALVDNAKK